MTTSNRLLLCGLHRYYPRSLRNSISLTLRYAHVRSHSSLKPQYRPTIGLELHVQLKSPVKLFSDAATSSSSLKEDLPNSRVAFFDAAIPGSLPILNPEPVRLALLAALALGCRVNRTSRFDRKHYFYPDLPAGYQITQKYSALANSGSVTLSPRHDGVANTSTVRISQIQLEQDTAKSTYDAYSSSSLIDLNRAGTALIEIISEPDMHSAPETAAYVRKVQALLRAVGASDADMEKGSLRIDVNVSVAQEGSDALGTRCEVKNLNSIRSMVDAIEHEIKRHSAILDDGGSVEQQTRGFDAVTGRTTFLRSKADAPDYRYMPDPELGPLIIPSAIIEDLEGSMPELPDSMRERIESTYGLSVRDTDILVRLGPGPLDVPEEERRKTGSGVEYFEALVKEEVDPKDAANWIINELLGNLTKSDLEFADCPVPAGDLAKLIKAIKAKRITNTVGKRLLAESITSPGQSLSIRLASQSSAHASAGENDGGVESLARQIIDSMPAEADKYRKGKKAVLARLVGQGMRLTKGQADAVALGKMLEDLLQA